MTDTTTNDHQRSTVFFGTSQGQASGSLGIYQTSFDPKTGALDRPAVLAARIDSPGFLCQHPALPVLYSTGRDPDSGEQVVASFAITKKAANITLVPLNRVPTGCGSAVHLAADPDGKMLVTTQYGTGTVAAFALNEDGSIRGNPQVISYEKASKANPRRQEAPHPHSVTINPSGRFALIADLGADIVYIYRLDKEKAALVPSAEVTSPPGSGPRHLKFSRDGRFVHVLNELSLTIDTFTWDESSGSMTFLHSVQTLPDEVKARERENTASEIQVSPDGSFVYAANRGNDSLSVFKATPSTGLLELIQIIPTRTAWPRHFSIDQSGNWLVCAGQDSFNVGVFSINQETGRLTYMPQTSIHVPSPICVHFVRP